MLVIAYNMHPVFLSAFIHDHVYTFCVVKFGLTGFVSYVSYFIICVVKNYILIS